MASTTEATGPIMDHHEDQHKAEVERPCSSRGREQQGERTLHHQQKRIQTLRAQSSEQSSEQPQTASYQSSQALQSGIVVWKQQAQTVVGSVQPTEVA